MLFSEEEEIEIKNDVDTTKRLASTISSEASSQISISSDSDDSIQVFLLKRKSLSMSCLPDQVSSGGRIASTLPHNLNTVDVFKENLPPKERTLAQSWYQTAECLETDDGIEPFFDYGNKKPSVDIDSVSSYCC